MKNGKMFVSMLLAIVMLMVSMVSFVGTAFADEIPLVRISLDEWIGWKNLVDANGGLKTAPGSLIAEAGLNIEFVPMNDATISSSALINGQIVAAGYTVNRYSFLQDKFNNVGLDVVMPFITNFSNGGDGVIASNEVATVEDLVDKKVAVPRFSEAQTLIEWILMNSKLTENQQKDVRRNMVFCETADDTAELFFSENVDAAATWEPYLTMAHSSTDSHVLFSTADNTNLILDGLVFRKDFLEANPDFVKKLAECAFAASPMYKTDFTYIREMPMFSLMTDEEIIDMANGADLCTLEDNQSLLVDGAISMYEDMATIWKNIGEYAYPEQAKDAFDVSYISR